MKKLAALSLLVLWLLVEASARHHLRWFALSGLTLALATLTRSEAAAFVPPSVGP